jgi:dTMP kinase
MFIAIEGGDGSGKGTHSELLQQYFIGKGADATKLSFPRYGSDSAFYVEKYLNGAYGLADDVPADLGVLPYAIDRYAASADLRLALSGENAIVIADRYMASNLAHQGAKIDDADERAAFYERTKITEYGVLGIPKPDRTIVLVMPTEHMQSNVDKKAARDYTSMKRDIHEADAGHLEKAKSNFEELCRLYPTEFTAVYCTDEAGAMRPIDEIQDEIRSIASGAAA